MTSAISPNPRVQIIELHNAGDPRGASFTIPTAALEFVGTIRDLHLAQILPGAIRGNHYHLRRMEAIVIYYHDDWTFHWDEGDLNPPAVIPEPQHRDFSGSGAAVILVTPGCSHAITNRGAQSITILGVSSELYDPAESVTRKLI